MKILVATDGSKNSLRAVKHVAKLATLFKEPVSVTLVSVHDDIALRHAQRFVGRTAVEDYLRDLSEKDLAEARKVLDKAGLRHDMVMRTGHVAGEIAAAGTEGKFDFIVMGSKGRSALKDLLVGSVARRVIEVSKIPVMLIP